MKSLSIFFAVALRLMILLGNASPSDAVPTSPGYVEQAAGSSYWVSSIQRQGTVPFSGASDYQIFRNVKDFGAKGDGTTDDTAAINNAITTGNRCAEGCDSSTTTPALVYFPPGTYAVSKPIVQLYYTQFVGDAVELPTLKATPGFTGIAVIDSDPYNSTGGNWYTNQNNFYRQVRNFVIDLTALPPTSGAGIHWQVGQATSLQNIIFNMVKGGDGNAQQGIFMDNGSGGFMSDLIFNGGHYGAFFGNQQFTTRNLTFNNCDTAIYMNWNWLWALKSVSINNCGVGIDMSNSPTNQTVGSVLLSDSTFTATPVGVKTAWTQNSVPPAGGALIIDNVDFSGSQTAVQSNQTGSTILAGGSKVASWIQGRKYAGSSGSNVQQNNPAPSKPAGLLDGSGNVVERSKPQYENVPASNFVSVKSKGAKGDGTTDDTQAIQNALNGLTDGQVLYFDHGAYVVSSTVRVPTTAKITGEMWPLIMAKGSDFQNQNSLMPVFQVGQPGDTGSVEITDLVFETIGPQPGAVMIEWNLAGTSAGAAGMWDTHVRIGGTAGTGLQSDTCAKNPTVTAPANPACEGAGLMVHFTKSASAYVENVWAWVADHELDRPDHGQINIFNGRGMLIESTNPLWLYGTASEHSVLYNYELNNAQNVYMSIIQTETPYFQANPDATTPFTVQSQIGDPTYAGCDGPACKKTWGLNIQSSSDVLVYGAGLYSFFDNYDQDCATTNNCQENMVNIQDSPSVSLFGLSTKAAVNMATVNGAPAALDADNRSNFCATLALLTP